jgi:hypothetical protein
MYWLSLYLSQPRLINVVIDIDELVKEAVLAKSQQRNCIDRPPWNIDVWEKFDEKIFISI